MSISVRPATIDDVADLVCLNALFNQVYEEAQVFKERMLDPKRVETALLVEVDGKIVGFAVVRLVPSLCYSQPYAELTELFVEEEFRTLGAGGSLLAFSETLARENGAKELTILTSTTNTVARAFYQGKGYKLRDIALVKRI